jgi:hypothetical protein
VKSSVSYILSGFFFAYLPSTPLFMPVTVAERSKACTVFARSEAGTVGSNTTQGMDV